jgi:hypothetical protein
MKTYMYDVESGIYEGEAYEDADLITYVEGLTTFEPPPCEDSQVPVFDQNDQRWYVVSISEMKKRLGIAH